MDSFQEIVEKCRKHRIRQMIENASIDHAAVLAENLLLSAIENQSDVKIVSGSLDKRVFGGLAEKVRQIVDGGNNIDIVLTDPPTDFRGNNFFDAVEKGRVSVAAEVDRSFPHFIVVGGSAYRLEVDHGEKKAKANFNDPDLGGCLVSLFDDIKLRSQALKA